MVDGSNWWQTVASGDRVGGMARAARLRQKLTEFDNQFSTPCSPSGAVEWLWRGRIFDDIEELGLRRCRIIADVDEFGLRSCGILSDVDEFGPRVEKHRAWLTTKVMGMPKRSSQ